MSQRAGRKDRRAPLHLAKFKDRLSDAEFGKNLASLSNQFAASADRSFESQKRGQLFIRTTKRFPLSRCTSATRIAQAVGIISALGS